MEVTAAWKKWSEINVNGLNVMFIYIFRLLLQHLNVSGEALLELQGILNLFVFVGTFTVSPTVTFLDAPAATHQQGLLFVLVEILKPRKAPVFVDFQQGLYRSAKFWGFFSPLAVLAAACGILIVPSVCVFETAGG